MQPDCGTICAFWVGALISAIHPASACYKTFRSAALKLLLCFVYAFTGHAVPRQLRGPLCSAGGLLARKARKRTHGIAVGSEDNAIEMFSKALVCVLASDGVFSAYKLVGDERGCCGGFG
jgi:hypothetical protein